MTPSDIAINYYGALTVTPFVNSTFEAQLPNDTLAVGFIGWLKGHNYTPARIGNVVFF
jgi:hypothetical protein